MNVEDYIELLATPPYILDRTDHNLIYSFVKQVSRGMAFTDRQYELAKAKILYYKDQFISQGYNPENDLDNLRLPIRTIDRSRWLRITEYTNDSKVTENIDSPSIYIAVRFTFQKRLISVIEQIKKATGNQELYDKETKVHYFHYSEKVLFDIIEAIKDKNFDIDETAQTIYKKLKSLKPEDHIPGVYGFEIKNLHANGKAAILNELGEPSEANMLLYKDRSLRYGLGHVSLNGRKNESVLGFKIANRKTSTISVNNKEHTLDNLFVALDELDRYPILFILSSNDPLNHITEIHQHSKTFISPKEVSVMFRLDNTGEGAQFNNYIKQQGINNKLDINTKIVYTIDHTVPKPLIKSGWDPKAIVLRSVANIASTKKSLECFSSTDLVIHYQDDLISSYKYYFKTDVEKI